MQLTQLRFICAFQVAAVNYSYNGTRLPGRLLDYDENHDMVSTVADLKSMSSFMIRQFHVVYAPVNLKC